MCPRVVQSGLRIVALPERPSMRPAVDEGRLREHGLVQQTRLGELYEAIEPVLDLSRARTLKAILGEGAADDR
jgi:hypothetical protein